MRVVCDTVVFVRGLIKPDNACGRIIFLHGNKYKLVVSKPVIIEILEVLQRPQIKDKFSSIDIDYEKILDFLSQAEIVEINDIPNISRDVKDNKFLATAITSHADYLISKDKDLLDIKKYEQTEIVTCLEFADIIKS